MYMHQIILYDQLRWSVWRLTTLSLSWVSRWCTHAHCSMCHSIKCILIRKKLQHKIVVPQLVGNEVQFAGHAHKQLTKEAINVLAQVKSGWPRTRDNFVLLYRLAAGSNLLFHFQASVGWHWPPDTLALLWSVSFDMCRFCWWVTHQSQTNASIMAFLMLIRNYCVWDSSGQFRTQCGFKIMTIMAHIHGTGGMCFDSRVCDDLAQTKLGRVGWG